MARLSPHFSSEEFRGRGTRDLASQQVPAVRKLCVAYLEPLRERFGPVTVHSGNRGPVHNASVGGAPASRHVYARHPGVAAADVSCLTGTPHEWRRFLESLNPGGLGVYPTHVHVDTRAGRARW